MCCPRPSTKRLAARRRVARAPLLVLLVAGMLATGCGTTRMSAPSRTATEQLLISDAIDRAVGQVNFRALAGQSVYLEDSALNTVVDRQYLSSSLRQHLLASGCVLRDKRDNADFVVEARAGVVGTDSHDLLFGVPAMQVPQFLPLQGVVPSAIPEVPFAKRQEQRGLAKVAVFAYHRDTGMPVWQSGMAMSESTAKNFWVLGAGPFQKGTIYEGTNFAGAELKSALAIGGGRSEDDSDPVALGQEASFASPLLFAAKDEEPAPTKPAGNIPPPKMATKPGGK
ncbi:DUF6655 family protein [Aeoliella sp.]|uniref:DUF6655 family protein n=1 Tax=Aeoliella sp. TaxID=2795800 RepID=UPI003CCB8355